MSKQHVLLDGYSLSKAWFAFAFENADKINPNHGALYFFAIELCNSLGWPERFQLPSHYAMTAIGMKSYKTYISALNDLIEFGFIKMIEKSKNQYSANWVALVKNTKAHTEASTKAYTKPHDHTTVQSTHQSTDSKIKQENNKTLNNKTGNTIPSSTELVSPHFENQIFSERWKTLIAQPKWKRKTSAALDISLKKLSAVSVQEAVLMMENTIAGGWQGIFEIEKKSDALATGQPIVIDNFYKHRKK